MNMRQLRYFLAVAEERHFGRAALKLHIVQPALSIQIRTLEEEMGGPLFSRTGRGAELTEAGLILKAEAERIVALAEHAEGAVRRSLRGEIGLVRVAFTGISICSGGLSEDIRAFQASRPDVGLRLKQLVAPAQVAALLDGQIDVGYCPAMNSSFSQELDVRLVRDSRFYVAMAEDNPLAANKVTPAKALQDEPLVLYSEEGKAGLESRGCVQVLSTLRQVFGTEPNVIHCARDILTVLAMASTGRGVGLVPEPYKRAFNIPNVVYRQIVRPAISMGVYLLSRKNESGKAVLAFLEAANQRRNKEPRA